MAKARKTNVLVVFANPKGTDPLRLGSEDRAIQESIKLSQKRDRVNLVIRHATTIHDIRRELLNSDFRIVHISGHGTDNGLILETESGDSYSVPQYALADLLKAYSPPIECVILNACYSISQGRISSMGVPYTVAMEGAISDDAAVEFSRGFYDAVGAGRTWQFAYEEGCRTVSLTKPNAQFISQLIPGDKLPTEQSSQSILPDVTLSPSDTSSQGKQPGPTLDSRAESVSNSDASRQEQTTTSKNRMGVVLGKLVVAISVLAAIVEIFTGVTGESFFGIWSILITKPKVETTSFLIFTESFEDDNLDGWEGSIITPTRGITTNVEIVSPGRNNSQGAVQVMHTGPATFNGIGYAVGLPGEYKAGNFYRASVWCKTEVGTECHIYFGDGIDSVHITKTQKWCPAGSEWQSCSICRELDKDKPVMSMFLYADETNEDVKIYDDVQIEQTESCSQ